VSFNLFPSVLSKFQISSALPPGTKLNLEQPKMSSIWPLRRATRSGTHDNVPSSSSPNESNQPKKTKKKEKKGAKKNKEGAFVLSGPTNAQHLGTPPALSCFRAGLLIRR